MCHERLKFSLKTTLVAEQPDAKPARELLALRTTLYERALSKLDAPTVNLSLNPALMGLRNPDIDTLGAARTVTISVSVSTAARLPDRYSRAVTVTRPASQAWSVEDQL